MYNKQGDKKDKEQRVTFYGHHGDNQAFYNQLLQGVATRITNVNMRSFYQKYNLEMCFV